MMYAIALLLLVPLLAGLVDRVPLPAHNSDYIRPANYLTILFARNYVKSDLRETVIEVAGEFGNKHPEARVVYMDGGYALSRFIPMWPHKAHNSGASLDLAYIYEDPETNDILTSSPSWTGYGVYAYSKLSNTQKKCIEKNSSYSFTSIMGITFFKGAYEVNEKLSQELIRMFHKKKKIDKILVEENLIRTLGLRKFRKVKYAGCESVRHDDHFHIELAE